MTTILALSYLNLLEQLLLGEVEERDLATALFYFNRERSYVLDAHGGDDYRRLAAKYGTSTVEVQYQVLEAALVAAENARPPRVDWQPGGFRYWSPLIEMQNAQGLPALNVPVDTVFCDSLPFTVEETARQVADRGLPYHVLV